MAKQPANYQEAELFAFEQQKWADEKDFVRPNWLSSAMNWNDRVGTTRW